MIVMLVAVRDSAANAFNRPFSFQSAGLAIRSFAAEVNRVSPENAMNVHPKDFELYEIGSFDEESGKVFGIDPRCIARAVDHVVKGV